MLKYIPSSSNAKKYDITNNFVVLFMFSKLPALIPLCTHNWLFMHSIPHALGFLLLLCFMLFFFFIFLYRAKYRFYLSKIHNNIFTMVYYYFDMLFLNYSSNIYSFPNFSA